MRLAVWTSLSNDRGRGRRSTDFGCLADILLCKRLETFGFRLDLDDSLIDAHVNPQELPKPMLRDFGNLLVDKPVVPS